MNTSENRERIFIIGAGRGGKAMLQTFVGEALAKIIGIAETDPEAPGLALAAELGIPVYRDFEAGIAACGSRCLVLNLTHDTTLTKRAGVLAGVKMVIDGQEAELLLRLIDRLRQANDASKKSHGYLSAIIANVADGIITADASGTILDCNPAVGLIFGYDRDELVGRNVAMLMTEDVRAKHDGYIRHYLESPERSEIIGTAGSEATERFPEMPMGRAREVLARRKDGRLFPIQISVTRMSVDGECRFVGILHDITERKEAEKRIERLAHYDILTGLPNRTLFYDRLDVALALAKRNKALLALFFLDLDGFKEVNDSLGHDIGDKLLRQAAGRLSGCIREMDTLARMGGDEFTFILYGIHGREDAAMIAGKVLAALSPPFDIDGHRINIGASIGIAIYPQDDSDSADALIKMADDAMYAAKRSGKNRFGFHDA